MAFSDLDLFKTHAGVTATTDDAALALVLDGAEAAVRRYCGRDLDTAERTEYYDGHGLPDLVLRRRPVTAVSAVSLDAGGYYGLPAGAFAAATLQAAGTDYALVPDGEGLDGTGGASGRLRRLGPSNTLLRDFAPSGRLASRYARPAWPYGQGNIKVTYTAGYDPYPDCPADLTLAVNQVAAHLFASRKTGGVPAQSEGLGEASVSYAYGALLESMALSPARSLLAPYVARGF